MLKEIKMWQNFIMIVWSVISSFILFASCVSRHPQKSQDTLSAVDQPVNEPLSSEVTPSTRQVNYQKMEVTAFVHWGVNTYRKVEWTTDPSGHLNAISPPNHTMENPFSTDAWVKAARSFGSKLIIFTSKHHDGFCNYETINKPNYHIMHPSRSYRVDVLKQLRASCNKYDMKLGIYFSPWDASHASWGTRWKKDGIYKSRKGKPFAAPVGFENAFIRGVKAIADKPVNATVKGLPSYNDYFTASWQELLNKYQPVSHIWLDGANADPFRYQEYDFKRLHDVVRSAPNGDNITIFGGGDYGDTGWPGNEQGYLPSETWSLTTTNALRPLRNKKNKAVRIIPSMPQGKKWKVWEVDCTSYNPKKWFYRSNNKIDSLQGLLDKYYNSVGRNGVLLLNIAPGMDGEVPNQLQAVLRQFGKAYQSTFQSNKNKALSLYKKVKASNVRKGRRQDVEQGFSAFNAVDGDFETYWTVDDDKVEGASIEINLKRKQTIDTISLREYIPKGQRIMRVRLEAYVKNTWLEIKDYDSFLERYVPIKTIGYKRLVRFHPIRTSKIRLTILKTYKEHTPLISEIGLYKSSPLEDRMEYPSL